MDTLDRVLEDCRSFPTIMSVGQELDILTRIKALPQADLIADLRKFRNVLDRLHESHSGGTVFQVSSSNRRLFRSFASWLRDIAEDVDETNAETLRSVADVLEVEFPTT